MHKVPAIDGVKPLEEVAAHFYLRNAELKAILHDAGVQVLELEVARKRVALVNPDQAYGAICNHLLRHSEKTEGYTPLQDHLDAQAAELENLRIEIEKMKKARGLK